MKVRVESITSIIGKWGEFSESTKVYVDGKLIGEGDYGGEPEDNMRCRNYAWVENLLCKLVLALEPAGIDFEYIAFEEGSEAEMFDKN